MNIHTRFAFQRKPTTPSAWRPDQMPDQQPEPWPDLAPNFKPDLTPDLAPDLIPDTTHDTMSYTLPNTVTAHSTTMRLDDWLALFEAVKTRLVAAAGPAGVVPPTPPQPSLQTELQDCVRALDQLQRMLPQASGSGSGPGPGTASTGPDEALLKMQSALARSQQDLAQAHAARLQASHRALHDGLTTLPNRDCFRQRLELELAQPGCAASGLAVLYLDLDGLKLINDGHGHAVGDELLRIVAARLARSVRAQDMVCRLGGDEFACLLGNVFNRDQLSHLACKLFDAVSAPLKIGDLELTVRPSIGIAVCPTDGNNSDALLRHADSAMYRAKRQQLGYAFFDASSDR